MHDAMALENRGIPTLVVCTAPFMDSALIHARTFGRTGFQPISIPHPLGALNRDGVKERAAAVQDQVVKTLTSGQ
ncbi:MAG: hypothetical protein QF714_00380 [Dehalococcoidia bacterium]|jgi:hypothetical protein|nr:hypothetical protein [Dehalococcoidia bacterium]MDP6226156.1 hypothetical protein [Dehalococcoidia bacterium]MDP7085340.1 hypothetical protein [Dehalococcoidia bacterium]MDP7202369.1 hypothetical protein [Dehalococcoidia bacterium]MDP7511738.1 hypothetical protein [Dehalococcoidia bacterium]|tara:strand:+ start:450 stop:674 length:225 start_codon:yes stop_codon:yes gene_type:complete